MKFVRSSESRKSTAPNEYRRSVFGALGGLAEALDVVVRLFQFHLFESMSVLGKSSKKGGVSVGVCALRHVRDASKLLMVDTLLGPNLRFGPVVPSHWSTTEHMMKQSLAASQG